MGSPTAIYQHIPLLRECVPVPLSLLWTYGHSEWTNQVGRASLPGKWNEPKYRGLPRHRPQCWYISLNLFRGPNRIGPLRKTNNASLFKVNPGTSQERERELRREQKAAEADGRAGRGADWELLQGTPAGRDMHWVMT